MDELLTFAKWQFWAADKEEGSKISRLHNLQQAAKSGSERAKKQLSEAPTLREDIQYLWVAFIDLNNAGSGTISYQDIQAYSQMQYHLTPFEVEAIQAMNTLRNKHG